MKLGVVAHTFNPALRRQKQWNSVSSRLACSAEFQGSQCCGERDPHLNFCFNYKDADCHLLDIYCQSHPVNNSGFTAFQNS